MEVLKFLLFMSNDFLMENHLSEAIFDENR